MKRLLPMLVIVALLAGLLLFLRHDSEASRRYTGFVEGEERVVRAEVSGRVVDVAFHEGDTVPAGALLARLDDADIAARVKSAGRQLDVLAKQIDQAGIEADLREASWKQDLAARETETAQSQSDLELAERTANREEGMARSGATTKQMLDDARGRQSAARSALQRAATLLAKTKAEEATIASARARVDVLRSQRELAFSQLAELEVTRAKFEIHAPAVPTTVQTQLLWPGELAQPGTPVVSVLDPRDKYVQIYVPVPDLARVHIGVKVEIELDSMPGKRWPGEISFVADRANFTPEKIETRADRVGQVYRAKVRILEGVESFAPGSESDVYLKDEAAK